MNMPLILKQGVHILGLEGNVFIIGGLLIGYDEYITTTYMNNLISTLSNLINLLRASKYSLGKNKQTDALRRSAGSNANEKLEEGYRAGKIAMPLHTPEGQKAAIKAFGDKFIQPTGASNNNNAPQLPPPPPQASLRISPQAGEGPTDLGLPTIDVDHPNNQYVASNMQYNPILGAIYDQLVKLNGRNREYIPLNISPHWRYYIRKTTFRFNLFKLSLSYIIYNYFK